MFVSPAALKLAVRLKSEFFLIVGVPMKCGDAAAARIGAIKSRPDVIVVAAGMPIFFMFLDIFPHQPLINDVNRHCGVIIQKWYLGSIAKIILLLLSSRCRPHHFSFFFTSNQAVRSTSHGTKAIRPSSMITSFFKLL
jgi:hypothetical protein